MAAIRDATLASDGPALARAQAAMDGAVAAAKRLARLEREQQRLAVERAHDDPLVMAEYRLTGEAFAGTVVEADLTRLDTDGKKAKLRRGRGAGRPRAGIC